MLNTQVTYLRPSNTEAYRRLIHGLKTCSATEKINIQRRLCRTDLYYLLWFVCGRTDMEHPWLLARCREVEQEPNGHLDLWSREHYKSSIITFGQSIQDVLSSHGDNPHKEWEGREATIGIFSHTRPQAKTFLRQIKYELESNELLKSLFPDVLYQNPQKASPKWSEDDGLVVRRKGNPKESTIEAHGLIDGMPTGKHFLIMNYDDVVTEKSVTTPEMIHKTTSQLELSYNLGVQGGYRRFIGTKYHLFDTYRTIEERQTAIPRIHPATEDGTASGKPVLLSQKILDEKRRDMGPYTFGAQILLNPQSEQVEGFDIEWLQYWTTKPAGGNRYIVVDPANEKRKKSDYTAAWVIELREDQNYYAIDMVRDRLSLTERTDLLFRWHKEYTPLAVGYEKYGKDSDIEHIEDRQERENYRFTVTPLGGSLGKNERIKRLVPLFEQGRLLLPAKLMYKDYEQRTVDLIHSFIFDEYVPFPVLSHDDMLDGLSRILDDDMHTEFPMPSEPIDLTATNYPSEFG